MEIFVKRILIVAETNGIGRANVFRTIYGKMEKWDISGKMGM